MIGKFALRVAIYCDRFSDNPIVELNQTDEIASLSYGLLAMTGGGRSGSERSEKPDKAGGRSGALRSRQLVGPAMIVLFLFNSCALFPFNKKSYLENFEIAHNLMIQNQPAEVIPYYRKALGQKKHFEPIYKELPACYQQTGELDSAVVYYMGAIALNPKNIGAYRSIEEILISQGKNKEAQLWHRDSTEVEEDMPRPYSAPISINLDYLKEINIDSLWESLNDK
ncbi:MAG: tetratricopeptide repeat protein [Candidatus Zixiibacteriota bacterium]|nr:MAG: tetratricopeptide repeat protein [candidate division Zixibacteria bacterium]